MPIYEERPPPRLAFLDGLRGIAALQVVILHYATAFLPGLVQDSLPPASWGAPFANSPFFFLCNGYAAVYVFFLMSGFVLRGAFMKMAVLPLGAWRRLVRLGVPAAAAACFAVGLFAADPSAHFRAAAVSGSVTWLAKLILAPASWRALLHEALLNSMLIGYQGVSVLPDWLHQPSISSSFNPPLWTLHKELFGSLICLGFAALFRWARWLAWPVLLVLVFKYGGAPLFSFVIGFALAAFYPRRLPWWLQLGGGACLALGLWSCRLEPLPPVMVLHRLLRHAHVVGVWEFSYELSGLLIFLGVLNLPVAQRLLETRPAQRLGHVSFALYLLHFPVMATLGAEVFLLLIKFLSQPFAALVTFLIGLAVTLAAALLFTKYVDEPAVRLSRLTPRFTGWHARPKQMA